MIAEAWLVLELKTDRYAPSRITGVKIKKVMQTRPTDEMAVKVKLVIDPDELQPTISVVVPAQDAISIVVEELDEPEIRVRRGDGDS